MHYLYHSDMESENLNSMDVDGDDSESDNSDNGRKESQPAKKKCEKAKWSPDEVSCSPLFPSKN